MHATILLAAAALSVVATHATAPASRLAERPDNGRCRDAIDQVRDSFGKPRLDHRTAKPGEATAWLAVDKRLGNCRVLVPVRDPRDIRLQPAPASGPARFIPGR